MPTDSPPDPWPKHTTDIPYTSSSRLNTLEVCIPRPTSPANRSSGKLWIIYIHGGAWRDPTQSAPTFHPTLNHLLASPTTSPRIAGYASLNYRLSPHPSHPTDPSNPADPARNARHPDHITDVLAALRHLQETYDFGPRYVLVGHSCGATLALQTCMARHWGTAPAADPVPVAPPLAVVGLSGLYDLPALVAERESGPHGAVYRDFVSGAFGSEEGGAWERVSPARWGGYGASWREGVLVLLAWSEEDELVGWGQVGAMKGCLERQGWGVGVRGRRVEVLRLEGGHDEIWEGGEAARAVMKALELLKGDGS